ncbi:hypothetical protein Tco_0548348 [Tanacetum coccineum]
MRKLINNAKKNNIKNHKRNLYYHLNLPRDDDKLYTFKEGYYNRLRLQDIEDMLLLLVQGKLTNLTTEECLALGVSLRLFTRSTVIRRRVEDLQLGVETYSNPKGFIYQNKDKKNRLMCIDELHKFSDDTLNDVRSALSDILKQIRMEYLPETVWRKVDKERELWSRLLIDNSGTEEHAEFDESDTYVLEIFDTSVGNLVKEILLKLNLPDHRSILTDLKVTPTNHRRMTKPYSSPHFIANCFNARYLKMEVRVPDSS